MQIILIDDDKLVRWSWQNKAEELGIKVLTFLSVIDFLNYASSQTIDYLIYIDSDLGNTVKGEYESKKLYDLGYTNLYLATGFTDLKLEDFPWLKGIVSKSPPF